MMNEMNNISLVIIIYIFYVDADIIFVNFKFYHLYRKVIYKRPWTNLSAHFLEI